MTLMIGVDEQDVDKVMELLSEYTHPRARGGWWLRPGKHREGAVAFVVGMEQAQLAE